MKKFIFTCGDINGIGPEIVIKTLNRIAGNKQAGYYFLIPSNVFRKTIKTTKPIFNFSVSSGIRDVAAGEAVIIDIGSAEIEPGKATAESGRAAYEAIELSFSILKNEFADAVITAPISKTALKLAGINYPGHTEMFADWSGTKDYAMSFFSPGMNCSLASIHTPIKNVAKAVTSKVLTKKLQVLISTLQNDLGIKNPSIAVLGLNPHAGENGLIGNEEQLIIKPLVQNSELSSYCSGPFSPDAFFAGKQYKNFDLVLGMYHDQVLIPFKMMSFNTGVNYTAGLPVVRTSPDHGTAFDIAGKNIASESSMLYAFKFARRVVTNRIKNASR